MATKGSCNSCNNFDKLRMRDGEYLCSECLSEKFPDENKMSNDMATIDDE